MSDYQQAELAPPARLCMVATYATGSPVQAALAEIQRRGVDCSQYRQEAALLYQERAMRNAQNDAATNALVQRLLMPPPAPAISPSIECRSYRLGSQVRTTCN